MTNKQENILRAALEMFANEGYNAVSTSKIAKKAAVSEGLIFRHFNNKKGLLDAIMEQAELKTRQQYASLLFETEPKKILQQFISVPFNLAESDYSLWRLQLSMKWQKDYYNPTKMKPVLEKLSTAFADLGYASPKTEAEFLSHSMEAISIAIIREGKDGQAHLEAFLKGKYGL